jgi:hypothetical protein
MATLYYPYNLGSKQLPMHLWNQYWAKLKDLEYPQMHLLEKEKMMQVEMPIHLYDTLQGPLEEGEILETQEGETLTERPTN